MGLNEHETDVKNRTSRNSASELEKTFPALESLNSDIRSRSEAQIMILGLDEHETDAKNRT